MKRINPDYITAIRGQINPSPYFMLQSMEVKELDWGCSRVEIKISDKHLQPFGNVHGGVFSGLIDAAGFWALYTEASEGQGMTTVEMKLNYLAPARSGKLIAHGKTIRLGRTLGLAEARVEDGEGRLLAHGTVTMMVIPGMEMSGESDLPAKYLE